MKINNKGFAITAVLYGLLILFVFLVGTYLLVLSAKKNRIDTVTDDLEQEYLINLELNDFSFPLTVPESGIYIFSLTDEDGNVYSKCTTELTFNDNVHFNDNSLKVNNEYISFYEQDCDSINRKYIANVNEITYVKG